MADTSAEVLAAALRKFGWEPRPAVPGRYDVWRSGDESDGEMVVPVDPARGDFNALLERALDQLHRRYGRQADSLLSLLQLSREAGLEETEWRKESPLKGMIAWDAGELLYASARGQLAAAAKATRERRRYHGSSSAYLAQKFLADSFMGQTDVGSFIISAYTPSMQRFYLTQHSEDVAAATPRKAETVQGSTILDTFEASISAARDSLDSYKRQPDINLFLEAVDEGVSYELVSALGDFARNGDAGIKITRRLFDSTNTRVKEVSFDADEAPLLDRVATTLVQDPEPSEATVIGEVTDLSRKLKGGVPDRVIRIDVKQGGNFSSVRVRLTAEQYDRAMAVHREEKWLVVRGTVEREGRYSWMYHPEQIEARERPATASEVDIRLDLGDD